MALEDLTLGEDEFCVTPHMGGTWSHQSRTDRPWNGGCQGRGLGRDTGIGALWGHFQCGEPEKVLETDGGGGMYSRPPN